MIIRTDGNLFFVAGINYRKCDTEIRGQFALNNEMIVNVLKKGKELGLPELFVLSTCNRTEIYGLAPSADILINLLCSQTVGTAETFSSAAYVKKNLRAVEHLYEVAAGLDSQILGDYEIVGQLKTAVKISKEVNMIGSFLDRMISSALQSSKDIKNNTALSGGTVSVSFAAVQMAKNLYPDIANKKILLLGTGKIGRNTCKNLIDYAATNNITIINRTPSKAKQLADEFGLRHGMMEDLTEEIRVADIIITATSAVKPIITREHLDCKKEKLIIDLSVPVNVSRDVEDCRNTRLIRVDELSKMKDETLSQRKQEIPKAKAIIAEYINDFTTWNERRKHAPMLNHLKTTLHHLYKHPQYQSGSICPKTVNIRIKQVLSDTARKLDTQDIKGCHYISAINQFIH